jgi:hypothetical protein
MKDHIYLEALNQSFQKNLDHLKEELTSYTNQKLIWTTKPGISNSAGNLAIHLLGNLNHFIGAVLGKTGYERNRPLEFSLEFKPTTEICKEIEDTKQMLALIILGLDHKALNADYPYDFDDFTVSTHKWLIQLSTHFSYHLGQINYHRRLLDS